jgi:hypothetical protein
VEGVTAIWHRLYQVTTPTLRLSWQQNQGSGRFAQKEHGYLTPHVHLSLLCFANGAVGSIPTRFSHRTYDRLLSSHVSQAYNELCTAQGYLINRYVL